MEFSLISQKDIVHAGFPSPADDYQDKKLDLNEYLIRNPASTFFVRVAGNGIEKMGIFKGDLLVVDRSAKPKDKDAVLAHVDGEFCLKRFSKSQAQKSGEYIVWGVVSYAIHKPK